MGGHFFGDDEKAYLILIHKAMRPPVINLKQYLTHSSYLIRSLCKNYLLSNPGLPLGNDQIVRVHIQPSEIHERNPPRFEYVFYQLNLSEITNEFVIKTFIEVVYKNVWEVFENRERLTFLRIEEIDSFSLSKGIRTFRIHYKDLRNNPNYFQIDFQTIPKALDILTPITPK